MLVCIASNTKPSPHDRCLRFRFAIIPADLKYGGSRNARKQFSSVVPGIVKRRFGKVSSSSFLGPRERRIISMLCTN